MQVLVIEVSSLTARYLIAFKLTQYLFHLIGICLPRNILDLFPENREKNYTYVTVCHPVIDEDSLETNLLSVSSTLAKNVNINEGISESQTPAREESAVSSVSDLSAINRLYRKRGLNNVPIEDLPVPSIVNTTVMIEKHKKNECFFCCRSRVLNKSLDTVSLNIQEPKDIAIQNGGKLRDSEVSVVSPESIVSDDSANPNMPDRISTSILRNVLKMANPIMFKACKKVLMELKQKYPISFQDGCLYADICKVMSLCSYRMIVRRFIQEIFLDLNFDALSSGMEVVLEVAQQRVTDLKLLDNSKMLPSSPPSQSSNSNFSHGSSPLLPIPPHKLHSLKSSLLASVYETSVENLMDSTPQITKDEVDAIVTLRSLDKTKTSPGGSTQVTAEVHPHRHSMESGSELLEPLRRRRFNTLELDLSCTKNKFPIKNRSPTGPIATSTLRRPVSLSTNTEGQQPLYKSIISTSDHSFEASSRKMISSPISPPLGTLFCEQRLLTTSRSEATLSNKKSYGKKGIDDDEKISKK